MSPHIDSLIAEEPVASDVVEMLFGVDHTQLVARTDCSCVAMDGVSGERISTCVYHQRHAVAGDDPGIHTPWRSIPQTRDRITPV